MYQKLTTFKLILTSLLVFRLINIVLANEEDAESGNFLNADQLSLLAEMVCSDLELDYMIPYEKCSNYLESESAEYLLSSEPLHLEVKCQTNGSTTIKIKPSEHRRLVIFVEESKRPSDYVPYTVIEPNEQFGWLETFPRRFYTVWIANLDIDSRSLRWKKGPQIPAYNYTRVSEQRDYNVSVYYPEIIQKGEGFVVKAVFGWNTSDTDMCYEVVYICDDDPSGLEAKRIWPTKTPSLILDLPTDDRCSMQVIGKYGTTHYTFTTPSCADSEDCKKNNKKPLVPEHIDVHASKYGLGMWMVRVNWTQPRLLPETYNITLRANEIESIVLNGEATEAIFKGVAGEGIFNVSIYSTIQDWTEHTSRRGFFPADWGDAWWWGAGGAWLLVLVAAIASAVSLVWRRHASEDINPLYPVLKRKIKGFDIEAFTEKKGPVDRWEVRLESLVISEVVGEGAFGVVRKGILIPRNTEVAVKMLKDMPSVDEIRSFRSEMELMKSVGPHPHVVSLIGCYTGRRPLILTEYCSRGDLLSFLRSSWDMLASKRNVKYCNNNIGNDYRNDPNKCKTQTENSKLVVNKVYETETTCEKELTVVDLLSFCRQIAMGMEFLAFNKVVHRDLAARNVLVTGNRTLKIADFGLSRDVYEDNQYKQKGNGKLPVKWMALESLTRKIYTTQSDVWSFGVVIWEVMTVGGSPYPDVPTARLLRLLKSGYRMRKPPNCSDELYDIMSACWRVQPWERPSFTDLHQRLDQLLSSACADDYLSLEMDVEEVPPPLKPKKYLKIFAREKRSLTRGESYERPLQPPQTNHYSSPPVIATKTSV